MSIEQLAHDVACARQAEATLAAEIEARDEGFEESIKNLRRRSEAARGIRIALEGMLRNALLEAHAQTGEKKFPGGSIRMVKTLEYSDSDALFWAQQHSMALALDRKAFEELAKSGNVSATIVTITEEAQATINSDLSVFLKEEAAA